MTRDEILALVHIKSDLGNHRAELRTMATGANEEIRSALRGTALLLNQATVSLSHAILMASVEEVDNVGL